MKIGRNARCPCGSGRKYKHCCGQLQASGPSGDALRDNPRQRRDTRFEGPDIEAAIRRSPGFRRRRMG